MSASYVYNAWYQAAWSEELGERGTLARTLLEKPILLMRLDAGGLAALFDRCPHRFAPLSIGRFDGARVACGYHGLTFDGTGRCVHNPHGPITDRAHIESFPVEERDGRIWVWFGEAEKADAALIPDMGFIEALPETARGRDYMHVRSNWLLLVDNLLDLSHSDYVHPRFGDFVTGSDMTVKSKDDGVTVKWVARKIETPHIYQTKIQTPQADVWLEADLLMPSNIIVGTGATVPGGEPEWAQWSIHNISPETATTSHYFFSFARDFDTHNVGFTAMLKEVATAAFVDEDKPILEAQQVRIGEASLFSLDPLVLPSDRGAVLARRKLQQLMGRDDVKPSEAVA